MMTSIRWCAVLSAATALIATGCGGGGGGSIEEAKAATTALGQSTAIAEAPGPQQARRVLSAFPRANTYRIYAGNGTRKMLRLDLAAGRYEMFDDGDVSSGGNSTSGSFAEDPAEPGTYVFDTSRMSGSYNPARFRIAQGVVVGGFPFELPWLPARSYALKPFVGANDFVTDRSQLDGEYTRLGILYVRPSGSVGKQITPLRISGGGTLLELCVDGAAHRLEQCTSIRRYALNLTSPDGTWTAAGSTDTDKLEFRMARNGDRNLWLEGGTAPAIASSAYSFQIGLPTPASWPSTRYTVSTSKGSWCTSELGQAVWARRCKSSNGSTSTESTTIKPVSSQMPVGTRLTDSVHLVQGGGLFASLATDGSMEIGLFKESLAAEPPSPANGTYQVFALNGIEQTLTLDFNAGSYQVTESTGSTTSGTFAEDPSDEGTYIFASSRIPMVYNTARFRVATDGIVGAFPFVSYGSDASTYKVVPFVAARSFVTNRLELAGIYEVMFIPGGGQLIGISSNGTTAMQCTSIACDSTPASTWPVSTGSSPGQWIINTGFEPWRFYAAKFGSRRVLLSSGETAYLTVPPLNPPLMGPLLWMGFRQPAVGFDAMNWPSYTLHTMSGTSYGRATLDNGGYSQEHLDQSGQPYPLSLSFAAPASAYMPSFRFSNSSAGTQDALVAHNGELFVMGSMTGIYLGLIDR